MDKAKNILGEDAGKYELPLEPYGGLEQTAWSPDGTMVAYANDAMEESLVVPEGVKSLQDNLFSYNQSVKNVILPSGAESIGDYCFYQSSLETISLPESFQTVGYGA